MATKAQLAIPVRIESLAVGVASRLPMGGLADTKVRLFADMGK